MEVPGSPLSEQDARKYFTDVVLGIEYCKSLFITCPQKTALLVIKYIMNYLLQVLFLF